MMPNLLLLPLLAAGGLQSSAHVTIDAKVHAVVRSDLLGKVRWSTTLAGPLDGVRPPHLVHDADRVYLTHDDGVTALDFRTGKVAWHAKGPSDQLVLGGGLLLAVDATSGDSIAREGRWVVARAVATGKERFRVRLREDEWNLAPIREVAGLFLVQAYAAIGGQDGAYLFDRDGTVRHRLEEQVLDGRTVGEGRVFVTNRGVIHRSADDKTSWTTRFTEEEWIAGGGLLDLEDGDLLAYLYGTINDSGVQVLRLDPRVGRQVWQVRCAPLEVSHSKYHHQATASVEGDQVTVFSRGSSGTFVESLDLGTGRQVGRMRSKP